MALQGDSPPLEMCHNVPPVGMPSGSDRMNLHSKLHGFDCWKTAASSKGGKGSLHLLGLFNPSKTCANQHKRASLSRKEKKRRKKKKKERKTEIKLLSPHSRANHPVSLTLGAPEDYLAPHLSSCLSDSGFLFSPPSLSLWASPGISLPLMQCLPTTRSPLQPEASLTANRDQGSFSAEVHTPHRFLHASCCWP